jgi:hypothetical protein
MDGEGRHSDPVGPETDKQEAALTRLDEQIQKLILLKETGPKSAAWHRARVQTLWRLQARLAALGARQQPRGRSTPAESSREN